MKQTLIYTTENNNSYIYDIKNRLTMVIHPELKKVYQQSANIDIYYLRKYEYLREHGFFMDFELPQFEELTDLMVKESIINTTQIVFEVTDSCNLACVYCGYGDLYEVFDPRKHNNIDLNKAKIFLEYIYNLKLENNKNKLMIGFYGGEPLVNFEFVKDIVEYVNELNRYKSINVVYSMTTNAVLIDKYIDFLVDNKFEILISLDGNEKNHSYRVLKANCENSFGRVISNIDMIQNDYSDYFLKYISFNAVLHNRNSVKEIYEFVYNRYHKIPEISELLMSDVKSDKKYTFEKMYRSKRKSEESYHENRFDIIPETHYESVLFDEFRDFVKQLSINSYMSNLRSLFCVSEKYFPTDTCLPFSLKIFFTVNNRLLPCERINHKFFLSEVKNNILMDAHEIANKYNRYYKKVGDLCKKCYDYKFCGQCLFRIKNIGKNDVGEIVCDRYCDKKKFESKLSRIFSFLEKYPEDIMYMLENE